jgi:RNA polymerase sigma-70 factor (ECF subfamily)
MALSVLRVRESPGRTDGAQGREAVVASGDTVRPAQGAGDPDRYAAIAFESMRSEFAPLVSKLIHQYGRDAEFARDLQGEIYCRLTRYMAEYDPDRGVPLRPYLIHKLRLSVFNCARDRHRQQRREASLDANLYAAEVRSAEDPTPSWDRALDIERLRAVLPDAIARLPERQRCVVIWRYYEGMSFEQIAEIMGVKAVTVRSLLRNGLRGLRRLAAESGWQF